MLVKELEATGKKSGEIRSLLSPLMQLAKTIVGDEYGSDVVEECAIWLLKFFYEKDEILVKDIPVVSFGKLNHSTSKEAMKVSFGSIC